jgi:hypothetical protein
MGRPWRPFALLLIASAALTAVSLLRSVEVVSTAAVAVHTSSGMAETASPVFALASPPPPPSPPPSIVPCASALSPELTHAAARHNDLGMAVATFANKAQADFAENWLEQLGRVGLRTSALVGTTDDASADRLAIASRGARCFRVASRIGSDEAKWGSPGFAQMGRTKALLLRDLLSHNVTVLFADVDVAFLRDPRPFIRAALTAGADILFHTDGFGSSAEALASGGLETPSFGWGPELNTGLFLATPACLRLAERWCDALKSDDAFANWKNDQQSMNELMRLGVRVHPQHAAAASEASSAAAAAAAAAPGRTAAGLAASMRSHLIHAFGGTLRLGLLPAHLFPSGHVFFIQRALHRMRRLGESSAAAGVPIAVHLTFQNCDQSGKRHRMREGGLWLLDELERHYVPEGGLLSYEPDLPSELTDRFGEDKLARHDLRLSDPIVHDHFRLINHQLLQLRTALKLSLLLNRTLVLPRFVCGLETVTNFAHRGIRCLSSNGCRMALPYYCPADHVLRMHYWRGVMPQVPALRIRYREWSVLDNLRRRSPARLGSAYGPERVLRVRVSDAPPARRCDRCGELGYVRESGADRSVGADRDAPASGLTASGLAASDVAASDVAASDAAVTPSSLAQRAERTAVLPGGGVEIGEAQLRAAGLTDSARARLVHFETLRPDAKALAVKLPDVLQAKFDDTIRALGGGFCCVEPERRGAHMHFWYNLLWDTPHVDRWGRRWTKEKPWVPVVGP